MSTLVDVDICNMALTHLASGKEIANLITEKSAEAQACRRMFWTARDLTLEEFAWPFATQFPILAEVAAQPTVEWNFSYRIPANTIMIRRVLSGLRTDSRQTRVPYKLGSDDQGRLLYCDLSSVQLEITARITNTAFYTPSFCTALSYLLAYMIAPRVTAGDPYGLGPKAAQNYVQAISIARKNAANEEQADQPTEAESIRVRDGMTYNREYGEDANPMNPFGAENNIE
jgi:hypothetical protein